MDHDEKGGISWGTVILGAGLGVAAVLAAAYFSESVSKAIISAGEGASKAATYVGKSIIGTPIPEDLANASSSAYAKYASLQTEFKTLESLGKAVSESGDTVGQIAEKMFKAKTEWIKADEVAKQAGSGIAGMTGAALIGTTAAVGVAGSLLCCTIKLCVDGMSKDENIALLQHAQQGSYAAREDARVETAAIRGAMKARAAVFAQAGFPVDQMAAGQARG